MTIFDQRAVLRRVGTVLVGVVATAVVTANATPPASAENNFSAAYIVYSSGIFQAVRGEQAIRTNPGTNAGVSYVHPFQAFGNGGGFMAIGTYKGEGTHGGGTSDCPDNYAGTWNLYTDGESPTGDYFCVLEVADAFDAGHSPFLRIARLDCDFGSGTDMGWAAYANGTRYTCRGGFNGGIFGGGAGLEVVAFPITQGYNIDVIHRDLELQFETTNEWTALAADERNRQDPYHLGQPNSRRIDSFLGTLD